jgi:hypothetical protein
MSGDWTTTYCTEEDGFPKVLYAATIRLGIPEHPEYVGREYVERGTESCEVTVHVGTSDKFLEMKPWSVTATGCRLKDTYELVVSVFNRLPTEGYTQGGKFWVRERRDQELEGAKNTRL